MGRKIAKEAILVKRINWNADNHLRERKVYDHCTAKVIQLMRHISGMEELASVEKSNLIKPPFKNLHP